MLTPEQVVEMLRERPGDTGEGFPAPQEDFEQAARLVEELAEQVAEGQMLAEALHRTFGCPHYAPLGSLVDEGTWCPHPRVCQGSFCWMEWAQTVDVERCHLEGWWAKYREARKNLHRCPRCGADQHEGECEE